MRRASSAAFHRKNRPAAREAPAGVRLPVLVSWSLLLSLAGWSWSAATLAGAPLAGLGAAASWTAGWSAGAVSAQALRETAPRAVGQPRPEGGTPPTLRFDPLPGADRARDEELERRLALAAADLLARAEARTEHRREDGSPVYANRLLLADSPYLRQHAFNPVDWHPWGEEAFARARELQRPIFLSIGYSTCHWCHVMERESFDDLEIARLLNQRFVCIKVDREQRPEVDEVYMTAVQLMTRRSGGWPLSVFLTPEGRPFHGGSYYPPDHFLELLGRVLEVWSEQRERIEQTARQVHLLVSSATAASSAGGEIDAGVLERAQAELLAQVDGEHGGFGGAPKFPQEPSLLFLARRALRTGDREALDALVAALDAMARGGIYDQLGGGFHRYATDAAWRVPHFEKMLYDQANLARVYTEAWRLTGRDLFRRVAIGTLDAALRDLGAPEGGFYSATDADSLDPAGELIEGAYFTWTLAELAAAAGEEAPFAVRLFGATSEGAVEGRNVLHRPRSFEAEADAEGIAVEALLERVDRLRRRLLDERARRPPPLRDEKLITAWNGMMITALAEAGVAFAEPRLLDRAARTAQLVWRRHRRPDGRLWRSSLDGAGSGEGVLEDYACLAEGLLALDRASGGGDVWLGRATELAATLVDLFADERTGALSMAAEDAAPLLFARPASLADGATPAGGSVAVGVLATLARRTGDIAAARAAERAAAALAEPLGRRPAAFPYLLRGLDELRHGAEGAVEYGGGGVLRVELVLAPGGSATPRREAERLAARVELRLEEGWHVNAHVPLAEDLEPTVLRVAPQAASQAASEAAFEAAPEAIGWRLEEVRYPPGERVELGFREGEMAVYSGAVTLTAELEPEADHAGEAAFVVPVELDVQICNDRLCLQPETLRLEVTPRSAAPASSSHRPARSDR